MSRPPKRAEARVEAVQARRRHSAQPLGVDDQDRRQGRRVEVWKLDLDQLAAGLCPQRLDRRLAGLADRGGDVLGDGIADDPDADPGGVVRHQLLTAEDRAEQARVGGVGAERAGDDRARLRRHVVSRQGRTAEGRLQPGQAAVGGGVADRADPVGADRTRDQAGGDHGGGAAGGAARAALGVPGIARGAVKGDVAGAAGTELVHVGHPDDRRPGVAQGAIGTGLRGNAGYEHLGSAEALGAPGQRPLVLDHQRHPVQGTGRSGLEHLARALRERLDHRVDRRVALFDPGQGGLEQLACVDLAGCDRGRLVPQ